MSATVDEQCALIREQGMTVTSSQLKTLFDVSVSPLDMKSIKEITTTLINFPNQCELLVRSKLVLHELMIFLRDNVLVDQLRRRETKDISYDLLNDLTTLFANICRHINNTNIHLFKKFLFDKSLINEFSNCLNEIGTDGKYLDNSYFLRSIGVLLIAFQRFEKEQLENDKSSDSTLLLSAVINCLCSPYAIDALTTLEKNFSQNLTEKQIFLLSTCPLFFHWYSGEHTPELFLKIPRTLLDPFTKWAISCPSNLIIDCSSKVRDMMRHLNFALVRPIQWETANISNKEFNDNYCKLVSQWSSFLQVIVEHSSDEHSFKSIARFIIQDLYNFTIHSSVLDFMKSIENLVPTLLKMTDVQQDEIQLNAFRCLGKLMTEDDIKTMNNPDKIAIIYVKFMSTAIDDPKKAERFYSLLESLKNWVQHDQVKVDLINQKILPILVRCVLESQFDPVKVQKPALEILLALSFIEEASSYLKENQQFMSSIRNLSTDTNMEKGALKRAADALLWKLEKESEALPKPTLSSAYQYDMMISYSHSDKKLCHQIYDQLIKDGFRVWIDKENMHGATMIAMANAIENSNIVLVCMSAAYKQSVYCQSEAHYAFERRRRLIPLIMEPKYKPDGWLGIIVSGKIYIHFAKIDFKSAYQQLQTEINQQQNTNQNIKDKDHQKNSIKTTTQSVDQYKTVELPHCVYQWNQDHVKSFFISNGLKNTLFLLCMRMDGHRLLQLYEMCMINRESMFQSLKAELAEVHQKLLPIDDYVTFLHKLKIYVPINTSKFRTTQSELASSVVCTVM